MKPPQCGPCYIWEFPTTDYVLKLSRYISQPNYKEVLFVKLILHRLKIYPIYPIYAFFLSAEQERR